MSILGREFRYTCVEFPFFVTSYTGNDHPHAENAIGTFVGLKMSKFEINDEEC